MVAPPRFEPPQRLQAVARLGPAPELLQPLPPEQPPPAGVHPGAVGVGVAGVAAGAVINVWADPAPWMLEALVDEEAEDEDVVLSSDEDEGDDFGEAAI